VKILRRMTAVESRAKEGGIMKRVRRYEFAFNQSLSSKRSRLQSVTEFPSSSAVGLVTTFNWGADVNPVALKPPVKTGINGSASSYEEEVADFDGDGRSDILVHNWPTANNRYSLYLAKDNLTPDASGIIFNTPIATGIEPSADTSRNSLLTGDFNGDGKIDLLIWDKPFGNQRYNLMLSNGNGFDAAVATDIQADADGYRPAIVADFNGDGRSDLLVFNKPFNNARYNLYLATDSGFAPAIATDVKCWNGSATDNIHVGDFNGDGLLDVLTWHEPFLNLRYNLYLGTGSGFQAATATPMQAWGNGLLRDLAVDVNGDGLTDFLVWHYPTQNNFYNLYLAKGDGTFAPPVATPLSPTDRKQYRSKLTFDFNSDGILDFLCWNTPFSTTNYFATSYLGNGVGFDPGNATQLPSWDNSQVVNQVGDFDGDGRSDVMIWHSPYTNFRLNAYFSEQATIDLLQGVVNGHGGTSSFT